MTGNDHIRGIIQNLLQKLVGEYAPSKVILYGSYANGIPGPDSDIDLLVVKECSERFLDRWIRVQSILTGLHRGLPVEILVLTPAEIDRRLAHGDQFIAEILHRGEVLYAA